MGRLTSFVHVSGDDGQYGVFGPDDDVPEWAARKIGVHAWQDGKHPYPDAAEGAEPPRSGKGSGREAWAAFASDKGVDVAEDATRDELVADLVAAGVIEES
jgi:hypothetical protein